MKLRLKFIVTVCLLLALALLAAGCGEKQTPYQLNDAENYSVSVKYDANGGTFTTNTTVIVDSYNVSQMNTNSEGKAQLALLAPDDSARGKSAFTAINNGYFLAGWYTQRTENGTDAAGNPAYTYSGKWDFAADRLSVDPTGEHTSTEPVITLYAAWIPMFSVEILDLATGDRLGSFEFDPSVSQQLQLPAWNQETGTVDMFDFPNRTGYTYNGAYYDAAGAQPVDGDALTHPGTVNLDNGTADNTVMQLYVDWTEGEWYHIYNVEQFLDNASVSGNYVIYGDLDFTGKIWPSSLMYGNFTGSIQGNGHTFSNINVEQTNNSKTGAGLFGGLTETVSISDLTLQHVTVTIKAGTRMTGTCYGLLAGSVSDKATFSNVQLVDSQLQIDSAAYFGTDDYAIGLVCGMGDPDIYTTGLNCVAVGAAPESIVITVEDGTVTVTPAA